MKTQERDIAEELMEAIDDGWKRCLVCPHVECCGGGSEDCPTFVFMVWANIPNDHPTLDRYRKILAVLESEPDFQHTESEPVPICRNCGTLTPCSLCGTDWDPQCPICQGYATYEEFINAQKRLSEIDELDEKL
jgi:hypothetical protein